MDKVDNPYAQIKVLKKTYRMSHFEILSRLSMAWQEGCEHGIKQVNKKNKGE